MSTFASDNHVAQFSIVDTAAQVQLAFDALNALTAKVTSVSFTDVSPLLTVTEAQYGASVALRAPFPAAYTFTVTNVLVADVAAIGADPHVTQLAIVDSASHVQANLAGLEALASKITQVSFTDGSPVLTLTEAQYNASSTLRAAFPATYALTVTGVDAADAAGVAIDSHVSSIAIVDAAANVQSALGTLEGLGAKIGAITLSDLQRPTLTVTEAQYSADWQALQKLCHRST